MGRAAKMNVVVKAFVIVIWVNAAASMDLVVRLSWPYSCQHLFSLGSFCSFNLSICSSNLLVSKLSSSQIFSKELFLVTKAIVFHDFFFLLKDMHKIILFTLSPILSSWRQGKDVLRDCSWTAIILDQKSNHMATGLCLFVLLIAIHPEPCAFVEKVQNIQIALFLRHVDLK